MRHPLMPYHRLPADAHVPQRLAPGVFVMDRDQAWEEAEEVCAYLSVWLTLVDPDGADDVLEQYKRSKGERN